MTEPNANNPQSCPICGVSIIRDKVYFSSGSPGTRARLYARVCQYAKQRGCINQDPDRIGNISKADEFVQGKQVQLPSKLPLPRSR